MALFGFLIAVAFVPFWMETATAPRWIVFSIMAPLLLMWRPVRVPPVFRLLAVFAAFAVVSLQWTPSFWDGAWRCWQIALALGAFALGAASGRDGFHRFMIGMTVGVGVSAAVAVAQVLGRSPVPQGPAPGGLFWNKNMLAEAASLVFAYWIFRKMSSLGCFLAASPAGLAVLLAASRGAFLALGIVSVIRVYLVSPKLAAAAVLMMAAAAGWYGVTLIDTADRTVAVRLGIWSDALGGLTWFGHGAGSFASAFRDVMTPATAALLSGSFAASAHNDLLTLAFEFGVAALLPAWVAVRVHARGSRHDGACWTFGAFVALGATNFPLFDPATLACGALAAGCVCGAGRDRRGDDVRRRDMARGGTGIEQHVGDRALCGAGGGGQSAVGDDAGNGGDAAGAHGTRAADAGAAAVASGAGKRTKLALAALVVRCHAAARGRRGRGARDAGGAA